MRRPRLCRSRWTSRLGRYVTVWEPYRGGACELRGILSDLEKRLPLLPPAEREQVATQMKALALAAQVKTGGFCIVPQPQKSTGAQAGPRALEATTEGSKKGDVSLATSVVAIGSHEEPEAAHGILEGEALPYGVHKN